jgi:hypothetical protein
MFSVIVAWVLLEIGINCSFSRHAKFQRLVASRHANFQEQFDGDPLVDKMEECRAQC